MSLEVFLMEKVIDDKGRLVQLNDLSEAKITLSEEEWSHLAELIKSDGWKVQKKVALGEYTDVFYRLLARPSMDVEQEILKFQAARLAVTAPLQHIRYIEQMVTGRYSDVDPEETIHERNRRIAEMGRF